MNPAALICALPMPANPAAAQRYARHLAQHDADAEALVAALEARPELADAVYAQLHSAFDAGSYHQIPPPLVRAAQRRTPLASWVKRFDAVREELAAAGAGIGTARWEAILALLDTFAGTPGELIELSSEIAHSSTP